MAVEPAEKDMTVREMSETYGYRTQWIHKEIREGRIKNTYKKSERKTMIPKDEINKLLKGKGLI